MSGRWSSKKAVIRSDSWNSSLRQNLQRSQTLLRRSVNGESPVGRWVVRLGSDHPGPRNWVDGGLHPVRREELRSPTVPVEVGVTVQEQFELTGFVGRVLRRKVRPGRVERQDSPRPGHRLSRAVEGPRQEAGVHGARGGEEVE